VGFSAGEGAKACAAHRVCATPTATNGAGEYETKPARPHHDRECAAHDVCLEYQYIETVETATSPRVCTWCPLGYKNTDDFSACYAYKCTHLTCKHLRHSCSKFNLNSGAAIVDNSFMNECANGAKLFSTIVTHHDRQEGTCAHGHWCGMGVISGDQAKCECAPLSRKPAQQDQGLAATPNGKGWTGHSDLLKSRHPDDPVRPQGLAAAGTPGARDRDAAVEYLGTKGKQAWDSSSSSSSSKRDDDDAADDDDDAAADDDAN